MVNKTINPHKVILKIYPNVKDEYFTYSQCKDISKNIYFNSTFNINSQRIQLIYHELTNTFYFFNDFNKVEYIMEHIEITSIKVNLISVDEIDDVYVKQAALQELFKIVNQKNFNHYLFYKTLKSTNKKILFNIMNVRCLTQKVYCSFFGITPHQFHYIRLKHKKKQILQSHLSSMIEMSYFQHNNLEKGWLDDE